MKPEFVQENHLFRRFTDQVFLLQKAASQNNHLYINCVQLDSCNVHNLTRAVYNVQLCTYEFQTLYRFKPINLTRAVYINCTQLQIIALHKNAY